MLKKLKILIPILVCFCLILSGCSIGNNTGVSTNENSSENKVSSETQSTENKNENAFPTAYATIIENLISAYPWNNDTVNVVPQNPELSYMYASASSLSDIGFALIDFDSDGQKELILTNIKTNSVYDMYTYKNSQAVQLFSGGQRYYFVLRENNVIENQWSDSAAISGTDFYKISGDKLELIERFTLDATYALETGRIKDAAEATSENCLYKSKSQNKKDYEPITAENYDAQLKAYTDKNSPIDISYTSLESYKNSK